MSWCLTMKKYCSVCVIFIRQVTWSFGGLENGLVDCKILTFKTFLSQIYGCALWSSYKAATYSKVKVSHNDIFRSLLNVPRYESASALFATYNVLNLDNVVRASYFSLMSRLLTSTNSVVQALVTSEARVHSRIWHRWGVALGRNMAEMFWTATDFVNK